MIKTQLVRGMLVGLAAGVLAFAFAYIFGEPQVQHAINFEDHLYRLHHQPPDPVLVSRGVQRTIGLLTGTIFTGVALGGLFSLVFAWAYGRIGPWRPRLTAAVLALAAYVTVTIIPFTKYPANPPTIGNPATIGRRTALFVTMIAISILAAVAAARIRRGLLPRLGGWNAAIIAAGALVVVIAIAELILPAVHETPPGFPADVLYRFRLASLGINATIWITLGLGFGALAERTMLRTAVTPGHPSPAHNQRVHPEPPPKRT
jgi:Probable cobalt transporter subunit (CbtA)